MQMTMRQGLFLASIVRSAAAVATAQTPAPQPGAAPAGGRGAAPRLVLWVSTTAWPDGGEVPMRHAGRGENKSPAFEFHWNLGTNPGTAPESLQTYAVIFHDIENASNKGTSDTLHLTAFNIPGTTKGFPQGLRPGVLPDLRLLTPGTSAPGR